MLNSNFISIKPKAREQGLIPSTTVIRFSIDNMAETYVYKFH